MATTMGEAGPRRVQRAFAFVDLSGFTELNENFGDQAAVEVLTTFRQAVRDVTSRTGVRVAKWLGDGAMIVGVETPDLVDAILDVEARIDGGESVLPLRAGLAAGPVILFDGDDYIGQAVNLAARLCDEARPHEVLAPIETLTEIGDRVHASHLGGRPIRGFRHEIDVVDLCIVGRRLRH